MGSQGSKLIAANLVELKSARKELESDVKDSERQGDFAEELRVVIEDLLETIPCLESAAAIRQDELECKERTERIDLQQRPRLRFSVFQGKPEDFNVFIRNTERIFQLYHGS